MQQELFIDVDTHITEPADTWTSRVSARFRDRVPRVERWAKNGKQYWFLGDERVGSVGLSAPAGFEGGPFPASPNGYDDVHPGAYDATERLKYMDSLGIWAQVLYPNVGGFGGQAFLKLDDPELMLECVRAYNDFQTEWSSADSRRLLPIAAMPFWDVEASVREVERCVEMGHRGILFTGEPQIHGFPFLGDEHWDPFWSVVQDVGLPISLHIGSGDMEKSFDRSRMRAHGAAATYAASTVALTMGNGIQVADLLLSGVLPRFPDLKVVSVESGIGWVPFMLEAADYAFLDGKVAIERPIFGDLLPSDYFRRQVYVCYWFEQIAPQRLLDAIGADNVMFETDFPHPTSLYDDSVRARIEGALGTQPADTRRKILWTNAAELYRVDEPAPEDLSRLSATTPA